MAGEGRQEEALEKLVDVASMLNNLLSDEELMRAVTKLLITPETLLVIDRLPQIIALLEKLSRPENLKKLEALVDLLTALDPDALASAVEKAKGANVNSLSDIIKILADKNVLRGLAVIAQLTAAISYESSQR